MTTPTRRDRQRAATLAEIKTAALDQLATRGPGGLTIRGVARAIGMSPAGLYRYYDGLDALITELIADAYNDLADAVVAVTAPSGDVRDRLHAGMQSYRSWAIEHPNRFLLIFGTPIPGYTAPEEGPTVAAVRRIGAAFFAVGVEALDRWAPENPTNVRSSAAESKVAGDRFGDLPSEFIAAFVSAWGHFHGLVTLELLHQLDWAYPDAQDFFETQTSLIVDRLIPRT